MVILTRRAALARWMAVAAVMAGLAGTSSATGPARKAPINLSDWGLHCWCITARRTPQGIIRADNNGQILALAAGGIARAELDRKLPGVLESQLALLQAYGLLTRKGDLYTTAFPVFGPELIGPIRAKLAVLSRRTAEQVQPDVQSIVASARAQHHPASAYAMVFGYALDGTVWEEMRRRGLLPNTTLDLDHPYWRGVFWAMYPERIGVPGRNETEIGGRTLVGIWTDATVASLNESLDQAQSGTATAQLADLPMVIERKGDPIHDAGRRIATKVTAQLVDSPEGRALLAGFPPELRQQALLAVAHEFIWSVMEQLVADRVVERPAILSSPHASGADVRHLLFVIDAGQPL